jgi:hypothetical protein
VFDTLKNTFDLCHVECVDVLDIPDSGWHCWLVQQCPMFVACLLGPLTDFAKCAQENPESKSRLTKAVGTMRTLTDDAWLWTPAPAVLSADARVCDTFHQLL